MFETWNHLPHWIRAIVLGNIIQAIFVLILRALMGKWPWLIPVIDRIGPKSLRTPGRKTGGGVLLAIAWFALSWYVGRKALHLRALIVACGCGTESD